MKLMIENKRMMQDNLTQNPASHVKFLTVTALGIALTYVFTMINIRLPIMANGGLVHLGNVPLFILAILFGKKTGAIAGGIGMGLFDLLSGWTAWAPFTLIIVGAMGFFVGAVTERRRGFGWNLFAMLGALVIKVTGYYIAEGLIFRNWAAPAASVPGNVLQVFTALVIVLAVAEPLRKAAGKVL